MDGREWDSETTSTVGDLLVEHGFPIDEPDTVDNPIDRPSPLDEQERKYERTKGE